MPPIRLRLVITVAVALTTAYLSWQSWQAARPIPSDLAQVHVAAGAWWAGINPYDVVGPGRPFEWAFPLYYPFTAILAILPLAALPLAWVDPLFVGLGAGLLAWGLTRDRLHDPRLLVFASRSFLFAVVTSQWSPLLTGAALSPGWAAAFACKPTLGLALVAWRPSWRAALLAGGFTALSLVIWPAWPWAWFEATAGAVHITAPVTRPGGVLMLAALWRWRHPSARLLLALAVLPQPPLLYEGVALFLIAETWLQSGTLSVLSWIAWSLVYPAEGDQLAEGIRSGQVMIWTMYVPATLMVLWQGWRADRPRPA